MKSIGVFVRNPWLLALVLFTLPSQPSFSDSVESKIGSGEIANITVPCGTNRFVDPLAEEITCQAMATVWNSDAGGGARRRAESEAIEAAKRCQEGMVIQGKSVTEHFRCGCLAAGFGADSDCVLISPPLGPNSGTNYRLKNMSCYPRGFLWTTGWTCIATLSLIGNDINSIGCGGSCVSQPQLDN